MHQIRDVWIAVSEMSCTISASRGELKMVHCSCETHIKFRKKKTLAEISAFINTEFQYSATGENGGKFKGLM